MNQQQWLEQLANQQRKFSEAWLTVANHNLALGEKLTHAAMEIAKSNLERFTQQSQQLLAQKEPQGAWQMFNQIAASNLETLFAQQRQLQELLAQHRQALMQVFDEQMTALNQELNKLVEQMSQSAPAGSELFVQAAKSAITAMSAAFENVHKALQQISSSLESNLEAVSQAASKAVSSAAKAASSSSNGAGSSAAASSSRKTSS